ncbi:hypothetical protein D3C76_1281710 [compost metagenome]
MTPNEVHGFRAWQTSYGRGGVQGLDAVQQAAPLFKSGADGGAQMLHRGQFQQFGAGLRVQFADDATQALQDGLHHQLVFVQFLGVR